MQILRDKEAVAFVMGLRLGCRCQLFWSGFVCAFFEWWFLIEKALLWCFVLTFVPEMRRKELLVPTLVEG